MSDKGKKPRNANREGKPWKRKDGLWCARVWPPADALDPKPRYVYARTRGGVVAKRDDLAAKLARGTPSDPDKTVGEYLGHWLGVTLEQYARAGEIAVSTLDGYRDMARLHIVPYLGHIKLTDLSAATVREWQDTLLRKPSGRAPRRASADGTPAPAPTLSARTAAYCRAILHKAIEDAIRDEVAGLERNVVSRVVPAKDRMKEDPAPIVPEEAAALLIAASSDRWWCYWLTAFATGFRRGEGLGMRWADLDADRRVWRPALSVQRVRGDADPETGRRRGQLVAKELKSKASRQPIALPVSVSEALGRWQEEQLGIRATAPVWADLGLVFTTNRGTAIEPRNINRAWDAVCARAGVRKIRLHDLRHACASFLLAEGVDIKTV